MSLKVVNGKVDAPVIPHITANIIPLATILKNYTEESYKELTQLLSTLQSTNTSDADKKKSLLLLLVKLRENFIRLYVLNKWSTNSTQFGRLIDLLNWLRLTIEQVSLHSIWGLRNLNTSLTSAKLPNPDLITSLEVLLNGRPKLPSYNFLPEKRLTPHIILKTLQNLSVSLAFRLSLLEELPAIFYKYEIRDGKVFFDVDRNFQCCLSIADDNDDNSQFFLIDFKFNFSFKDNSIIYDEETQLVKSHHKLEHVSNQILLQNRFNESGGLVELQRLLSQYTANYKLFLIHRQLITIRAGYWKSQITHTYSADKNIIIIHYWLKLQHSNKKKTTPSSSIEISITSQNTMQLKWIKDDELHEILPDFDLTTEELNIENILTNITEKHVNMKIMEFYESLVKISPSSIQLKPSSPSSATLTLILQLTSTKNITLSISPLSGLLYFINPTPLLASLLPSLNYTLANNFSHLPHELLSVILKTNFELLDSLMKSTDWLQNTIRVSDTSKIIPIPVAQTTSEPLNQLQYYRRRDWPQGWFLISCLQVDSSSAPVHIKWFVARIKLYLGTWSIQWSEKLNLSSTTENIYELLNELSMLARSRLLSQFITEDLEKNNAKLKILDAEQQQLPSELLADTKDADERDGPTFLIKNASIFRISNCHDNLVVKIELNKLNRLQVTISGKLKNFKINELHDEIVKDFKSTTLDYSAETNVFQVKSAIDGAALTNSSTELTAASIISSSNNSDANAKGNLLSSSVELLNKFSQMLKMLAVLSQESIDIITNNLSAIEFRYEGVGATLDISTSPESISIDFDDSNPHKLLQVQVENFLNSFGLLKTLKILKLSFPIVKKLSAFDAQDSKFTLIIHELNYFKIMFSNLLTFIRVDYNRRIVLFKFEKFEPVSSKQSNSAIDPKIKQFLESNFATEKFISENLFIVDIYKFDAIIDSIYDYLIKEY